MTFSLLEKSRWSGQPIGLLRLARGSLLALYNTSDKAITIGAETYLPLAITRTAIRDTHERAKAVLTLTLPVDAPCADWWRPYPPSQTIGVTWLAMHRGDGEVVIEWTGRVIGPKFSDTQLILNCEPTKTNSRSRGLVLVWSRGCPLALYSQGLGMCNVDKATHAVAGVVADFSGTSLQVDTFSTSPKSLAGGFLEWTRADGEPEFRSIMAHVQGTDLVVLQYGTDQLPNGTAVTGYPGCPHDWAGCASFGNTINYGGAKYMPVKTPFDGLPL